MAGLKNDKNDGIEKFEIKEVLIFGTKLGQKDDKMTELRNLIVIIEFSVLELTTIPIFIEIKEVLAFGTKFDLNDDKMTELGNLFVIIEFNVLELPIIPISIEIKKHF